jgi:formylmethanofuran dehydrogenase subunit E
MNVENKSMKSFPEVTEFHGHECPGSALGYRAAEAGMKELSHKRFPDEEIVAIVENDSCAVDAIQVVSGCTMGKGNLIFQDHGKQAYTFIKRKDGKGVRLSIKSSFDVNKLEPKLTPLRKKLSQGTASAQEKEELQTLMSDVTRKILQMPLDEIFRVERVDVELPTRARIYPSTECAECGDMVSEHRCRVKDGKMVCIPCFEKD